METVLIAGGTGLVGQALTNQLLSQGVHVILLTRSISSAKKKFSEHPLLDYAVWDPAKKNIDKTLFSRVQHIVNLAGAGVADKRWSDVRKKEISDSRVQAGELITEQLLNHSHTVKTYIGASAIGWYGPDPSKHRAGFIEIDPSYTDFLGTTCQKWEASTASLDQAGIRCVTFRIGIVLTPKGGALREFLKPLNFGIATVLGTGKQVVSWIHLQDLISLFMFAIQRPTVKGVYNAVAPSPVSNHELIRTLAWARGRFFFPLRVPAFVLKVVMGEMSIEVLKSTTVSSEKISQEGFQFQYPSIREALSSFF